MGKNKLHRTVALEIAGIPYIPIHDMQGNIATLLNLNGNTVEQYRYTAFGEREILSPSGEKLPHSAIHNPWQYSGKRIDEESGLIAFGLRYYDPSLGRWLTPDPAGFTDGQNLYAYVHNSPLLYCDQYGLFSLSMNTSLNYQDKSHLFRSYDGSNWGRVQSDDDLHTVIQLNYEKYLVSNRSFDQHLNSLSFADDILPSAAFSESTSIVNLNKSGIINPKTLLPCNFKETPGILFGGVNGIGTNFSSCKENMLHLANLADHNFVGVHSATYGPGWDIFRAVAGKCRVATETVQKIHKVWDNFFTEYPNGHICWTPHSRGCIDTQNALLSYPKHLREQIHVIAVAPACFINRNLCGRISYLVSPIDLVPWTDYRRMIRCWDAIEFVPADSSPFSSHSLTSPVYEKELKAKYNEFKTWYQ